jgi:chromosome segregation ATPase
MSGELMTGRDALVARLEEEIAGLRRELAAKDQQFAEGARQHERAVTNLRRQLSPLYKALQQVFGEIESIAGEEEVATQASAGNGRDARQMALWNDWKAKLTPACGKVIDALLLHPDLSVKQIKATAHMGENSVYQATSRLGQLGLLTKSGGRFSLKAL